MNMKMKILSIQKYLPGNLIESAELDKHAGLIEGWIKKNTGVEFRYHVNDDDSVSGIGAVALIRALDAAGLQPKDLDLLIFAGGSYDYPIPHNSCILKSKITDDSSSFPCLDVDSTCLSFLNGLDIAHMYLQSNRYKRIALVSAEIASRAITPEDPKVYGLFGDAAVALIIESNEENGYTPGYSNFANFPSGALLAYIPIGGLVNIPSSKPCKKSDYFFNMDGKKLIRLTVGYLDDFVEHVEIDCSRSINSFDYIISHQTSRFGNEYFANRFNLSNSNVVTTLQQFGNCISCSIPLGLEKVINNSEIILKDKSILLLGTAAGLSFGCIQLNF
jgi:3-oxoacyl-[acyl-carrier-protein] synthase-3